MSGLGVLRLPRSVEFGWGARACIPGALASLGRRVFVVVDPFLASSAPFRWLIKEIEATGVTASVHDAVEAELPVERVQASADAARSFAPDVILGYGGGSALDAAKLVALLLAHGGPLSLYYGENAVPGPIMPLVAVPTTAGTGSEVTPVAVVADTGRELKVGISSPHLIPTVAVVDPELSAGAPASVTAYAGIDALVHAIESFTARPLEAAWTTARPVFIGRNALSDPLSLEAIRLIGDALETAVARPDDRSAREDMAHGSLIAGMAFGSTGTHLSHALQYPIGALTHTPHGLGTGLMLPYVLAACRPAVSDRLAEIAVALGGDPDPGAAIDRVTTIGRNVGLPASLSELGIARSDLGHIAELALASRRLIAIAPVDVDYRLLLDILDAAWLGYPHLLNQ